MQHSRVRLRDVSLFPFFPPLAPMSTSQDDALIFQLNPADPSLGGEDDDQTEDPVGKSNNDQHHHKRAFDYPRLSEQPRGVIPALPLSATLPRSKRIALQRLTPQTRRRDRDLYREARD